jgi:carbon monoxide dehydrogenase subunit G
VVEVRRSIPVRVAANAVVDYLKDFAHTEQWDPGTRSCVRVGSGPIAVGAHWENRSEFRGRETTLDYELTRLDADRIVFVGRNKTVTSTDDFTVTTTPDGAEVRYRVHIEFHGLAKLADPFLRRDFERLGDEVVESLADAIHASVS